MEHEITVTLSFESDEYEPNSQSQKWALEERLGEALILFLYLNAGDEYVWHPGIEVAVTEV